jgi:hypothetical protein
MIHLTRRVLPLLLALLFTAQSHAQGADPQLTRLREQLRQSLYEARELTAENARLKVELETARQEALKAAENAVAKEELLAMQSRADEQLARADGLAAQLEQGKQALAQWQQAYEEAAALARTRDAEATRYEGLYREVAEHVDGCENNNAQLVGISRELIDRYKNKGVWAAAREREPLLGLRRVELERIAQEYHGRVLDATVDAIDPAVLPANSATEPTQP